jgi:hypothetical protein
MTRSPLLPGWCHQPDVTALPPNRSVDQPVHECEQVPAEPSARAAHLNFKTAASQTAGEATG